MQPNHPKSDRLLASNATPGNWDDWFESLFALARRAYPNGNTAAIEKFLQAADVATALRGAPAPIREKVDLLRLVGARDLDRIRSDGARLLDTGLDINDPGFGLYALVATAAACLASTPEATCREVYTKLDQVQRQAPVLELLRAHRAARG